MSNLDIIHSDLTVREVAKQLSSSVPTVYKLINNGTLSSYKLGRGTRVTWDSVEELRTGGLKNEH